MEAHIVQNQIQALVLINITKGKGMWSEMESVKGSQDQISIGTIKGEAVIWVVRPQTENRVGEGRAKEGKGIGSRETEAEVPECQEGTGSSAAIWSLQVREVCQEHFSALNVQNEAVEDELHNEELSEVIIIWNNSIPIFIS